MAEDGSQIDLVVMIQNVALNFISMFTVIILWVPKMIGVNSGSKVGLDNTTTTGNTTSNTTTTGSYSSGPSESSRFDALIDADADIDTMSDLDAQQRVQVLANAKRLVAALEEKATSD